MIAPLASTERHRFVAVGLVAAFVLLTVQLARGGGNSWIAAFEPHTLRLVRGHTVQYESVYFSSVVHGMLGGPTPSAFTTAHFRMWLPELVAAALLRWTGSDYLALALTDLVGALIGLIGLFWLGRTLGVGLFATALAAIAYALSPILAEYMWRNQLHAQAIGSVSWSAAATASMLAGTTTTLAISRGVLRDLLPGAVLLGLIWLATSWQYQYHFVLVPASFVLVFAAGAALPHRLAVWCGGVTVLVTLTLLSAILLAVNGLPVVEENNDPRNALTAFASFLPGLLSDEPARFLVQLLRPIRRLALTYQPPVVICALLGLLALPRRAALFCVSILAVTCASLFVRDIDRVAHAAWPAVYLSAAAALVSVPDWTSALARRLGRGPASNLALGGAVRVALLLGFCWTLLRTNADLGGFSHPYRAEQMELVPR